MPEQLVATRLAGVQVLGADFESAPVHGLALEGAGGGAGTGRVGPNFGQGRGGPWVVGVATLTTGRLTFEASGINRLLHGGELDFDLDLREVLSVATRPAGLGSVAVVSLPGAELLVHCVGAGQFAEQVDKAARDARRGG